MHQLHLLENVLPLRDTMVKFSGTLLSNMYMLNDDPLSWLWMGWVPKWMNASLLISWIGWLYLSDWQYSSHWMLNINIYMQSNCVPPVQLRSSINSCWTTVSPTLCMIAGMDHHVMWTSLSAAQWFRIGCCAQVCFPLFFFFFITTMQSYHLNLWSSRICCIFYCTMVATIWTTKYCHFVCMGPYRSTLIACVIPFFFFYRVFPFSFQLSWWGGQRGPPCNGGCGSSFPVAVSWFGEICAPCSKGINCASFVF